MPYPPQVFSLDGHAFGLTVSGVQVIDHVPTDISPIRWEVAGEGVVGSMAFSVESPSPALPTGSEVRLTDNVSDTLLAAGVLVGRRARRGVANSWTECSVVGWEWFLDRNVVPSWQYTTPDVPNPQTLTFTERDMLLDLLHSGYTPAILADASTMETVVSVVESAPPGGTALGATWVSVQDVTARGAIDAVLKWATTMGTALAYHYYVDSLARLTVWEGSRGISAPARVGDGSYADAVRSTSGLVEYWPLSYPNAQRGSYAAIDFSTLPVSSSSEHGVYSHPEYRASLFSAAPGTVVSASMPGTADWSLEMWFRAAPSTAIRTLWDGAAIASPNVILQADGTIRSQTRGGTVEATGVGTYEDDDWHHLVVVHDAGVGGTVYIDGTADSTASTSRTFTASGTAYLGGPFSGTTYFDGYLQHVAVYTTAMASATVLAHYQQGVTLAPEDISYEVASDDVLHRLYAYDSGGTAVGWVNAPPFWDTGWTSASFNSELGTSWLNPPTPGGTVTFTYDSAAIVQAATAELDSQSDIVSLEFSTTQLGGWEPTQSVTFEDSLLTGGTPVSLIIQAVNGEIASNIATYRVTAGAMPRSIVQTVAAP